MITFTIPGDALSQPRHEVAVRGRHAVAFIRSDKPIHAYKATVKILASQAMAGKPPVEGPISVAINFQFSRPKSHSKKRREDFRHSQKPDIDNLIKAVFDALNKVCFQDDSQIWELRVSKRWTDGPGETIVCIEAVQ